MRIAAVLCLAGAWAISACSALPSLPALSSLPLPNVFAVPPSPWPGTPVTPVATAGSAPLVVAVPMATASPTVQSEPTKPYHALAIARPPVANDFPVTYRVQVPSVDERVRVLPESVLTLESTVVTFKGSAGPAPQPIAAIKTERGSPPIRSQGPVDDKSLANVN